jgi:Ca2+-binding EF-hand superfamily protein
MKNILILAAGFTVLGGIMTSSAFAAKADGKKAKLIAKYDKNGNGVIDGDEMEALRKDFAADKEGELKAFDTNGDGKLDDQEIAAIKPGANSKSKTAIKETVSKYDQNHNGVIDGDEQETMRKDYAANRDGELKQFDLNADGKLDDQEIAAIKSVSKKEQLRQIIAKYDKNGNGMIDGDEKEAIRKDYAAKKSGDLRQFDLNRDGTLDDSEIAAIPQKMETTKGGKATTGAKKGGGKTATTGE